MNVAVAVLRPDRPIAAPLLVARTVWLEVLRREEYLAFAILMSLYLVFAFAARLVGVQGQEAVVFLLNMGLLASATFSAVLTAVTASRVLPQELERGTLYPLLAKPLDRGELILGKFMAAVSAGWVTFLAFGCATWLLTSRLHEHQTLVLVQGVGLQLVSLLLLGAFALCLSLLVPQAVGIPVTLGLYASGSLFHSLVGGWARGELPSAVAGWLCAYVPDFSLFSLFTRYTDGGPPLPALEWLQLAAFGVVGTLFLLWVAVRVFERRAL